MSDKTLAKKSLLRWATLASLVALAGGVALKESAASAGIGNDVPPWLWAVAWQAPHPSLPQVVNMGGTSFATPRIVPVLYAADGNLAPLTDFASKLGTNGYFVGVAAEYGVTGVTVTAPVVLTDPPPVTLADTDVAALLLAKLADPTFPQNDGQTIYAFVYPPTTSVSLTDLSGELHPLCGAAHSDAYAADGSVIPYTMTGFCADRGGLTDIDFATRWTTTALLDTATDPMAANYDFGYGDTDFAGSGWAALRGPEVALLCPLSESSTRPADLGYLVPRVFSNRAAAAGQEPCLPLASGDEPYFNAAPVLDGNDKLVKGVTLAPGGEVTIPLALFSDHPMGGWRLSAHELPGYEATPSLSFRFDDDEGRAGGLRYLTVRRAASAGATAPPVIGFTIVSSRGGETHEWPVAVAL